MKILYITNYPAPYAVDFFGELGKLCDLTVMFLEDVASVSERNKSWFKTDGNNFKSVFIGGKSRKRISFGARKYVKGYDLVFVGEYSSFTEMYLIHYMRKKKIKYAFSVDGGMKKDGRGLKEKLKRRIITGVPLYMSSGKTTDEFLTFYGAKAENLKRYPYTPLSENDILPAPLIEEEKLSLRKKLGMTEKNIVISVGQFIYRKGFDVLIRSAPLLKDTGVYIVGGEPTEEYISLKKELGADSVHFVGFKSKEELKEYYLAADLFVLPTREDIWGLVINEAMACALPVITTDMCVAGLELIENGVNGYIVPVNDERAIAEKVDIILSDRALKEKMAAANLKKMSGYTVDIMARRHYEEAKNLLNK